MFLHNPSKTTVKRTIVTVKKPAGVSKQTSSSSAQSPSSTSASAAATRSGRPSPSAPSSRPQLRSRTSGLTVQSSSDTNSAATATTNPRSRSQPGPQPRLRKEIKRKTVAAHTDSVTFSDSDSDSDPGADAGSGSENGSDSGSASSTGAHSRLSRRERSNQSGSAQSSAHDRRDLRPWSDIDTQRWALIHASDLTTKSTRTRYEPMFNRLRETCVKVQLHYPSVLPPERFALVYPANDSESYGPADDILHTMDIVVRHFLPKSISEDVTSPLYGLAQRFRRAVLNQSVDTVLTIVSDFNDAVKSAIRSNTIRPISHRSPAAGPSQHTRTGLVPLAITERILAQVYSRTVSPKVELLKQYENGTSDVYGELLPRFISQIFAQTGLTRRSVFVDFGSGVGNVVLQAALEIGCEAWGIEKNANPARLGAAQLSEFRARTRLWGIKPGQAKLVHGDFCANDEIDRVLSRADVILVNNKAFLPDLNHRILMKFLDVKDGARIVSLLSFLPKGWQIKPRNTQDLRNMLRVEEHEYFSGSVSWTDSGGQYFIATKDSRMLRDYIRQTRSEER